VKHQDSTLIIPFDKNKITNPYSLDTFSDTTNYKKYIWNDKRNLGEILNEKSGYYLVDFGMGSKNLIFHNSDIDKYLGYFKDGIQINDPQFGGFDIENISINEIDKFEEVPNTISFLYGLNVSGKSVNIITKDFFQPKTFSQFRYSQDRTNSLNADINFTIPFSEKFNFSFGLNSHSTDGRYINSDFTTWRGRIRLNYFPSAKINFRFNFNYAQFQRGLNEGLINSTNDSLADPILAQVVNPDSYEKLTNFLTDLSINARILYNDKSLTKLRFYVLNSVRLYRDEENRPTPNGIYLSEDFRTILYGIDLKQNIYIQISNNLNTNILLGYNGYFNYFNNSSLGIANYYNHNSFDNHSFLAKVEFLANRFFISTAARYNKLDNDYFNYGGDLKYIILEKDNLKAGIKGGVSKTAGKTNSFNPSKFDNRYFDIGAFINFNNLNINCVFFNNQSKLNQDHTSRGINISADFEDKYFSGYISVDKFDELFFPNYNLKTDFSYHDFFFKNKLNLRLGVNIKYANNIQPINYNQIYYSLEEQFGATKNYLNVDFYIGARIGSANINFTFANVLNSFNYNAYLYPMIDRGGVLQSLSRFTIVWDFLN
jgi:hypothetical protein